LTSRLLIRSSKDMMNGPMVAQIGMISLNLGGRHASIAPLFIFLEYSAE